MLGAAPFLVLLLACASKPPAAEPAPAVEAVHSNLLTVADIRIAAGVDTTHAPTLDAVNCLRRFLTRKMDPEAPKDYWYAPDDLSRHSGMENYGGPYAELLYAEFDSVGDLRYRPTVLEARSAGEGQLLLTVMWSDVPGTLDLSTARYVFEFRVRSTAEGARLSLPLEYNTAGWERRTVGPITYVISPRHVFNPAPADLRSVVIPFVQAPHFP